MPRILNAALAEAADQLADKIAPVMLDTFQRLEGLRFDYDRGNWEAILAAITEKIPTRLKNMPLSKQDRVEILAAIDFLDRSVMLRGSPQTAEGMFKTIVGMIDMLESVRKFLKLKVTDGEGNDITEEVFGR